MHQRHHQMNDIIWRAIKCAQIPATKEQNPSVSYNKMENAPMAPHCYLGHEASPWHGTSQFLTAMLSHT